MMAQRHLFVNAVSTGLRRRCGVGAGERLLVAVSGGGDSIALLRALINMAGQRDWQIELAVGHVQHHLRDGEASEGPGHSVGGRPVDRGGGDGGDAEQDAVFVEALAGQFDLPFYRVDLDLSSEVGNVEAAARRGRYHALAAMAETFRTRYVVCAHQADDQLETVLMRMLRGASVRGLSGMAWRRRLLTGRQTRLIRPMLGVDRKSAERYLQDLDQPWREDHTNRDLSRSRARLRHEVLPVLRGMRPDVAVKSVGLTDHMRAVARIVEDAIELAADRVMWSDGSATFDRADARSLPRVVLVGLLRRILSAAGAVPDKLGSRTMNPVVRAIRDRQGGQRSFDLSGNVCLQITRDTVRIGPGNEA